MSAESAFYMVIPLRHAILHRYKIHSTGAEPHFFYILSIQSVKPTGSLQLSSATHTRSQLQIVILCQNYITKSEAFNLLHLAALFLCFAFLFASVVVSCLIKKEIFLISAMSTNLLTFTEWPFYISHSKKRIALTLGLKPKMRLHRQIDESSPVLHHRMI